MNGTRRQGARQGGAGPEAVDDQGVGGEREKQSRQQVTRLNSTVKP